MKTIEFTVQYKMGHTFLKCKTTMVARNVQYIQDVPPEIPEYTEGVNSLVAMPTGERLMCNDQYDDLSKTYAEAMESES